MRPDLRTVLLQRAERDQAARDMPEPAWETVASVDADNFGWLTRTVAEVGWPGRSMVGEDGAHAAWLLAQHADRDPAFQRWCLDLVARAAACGEASPAELAYLTDRVRLAEGQAQEYGTQFAGREGGWVARRLRDPEHVDERRAAAGLGPLADAMARVAAEWGPPRPATITCAGCANNIEVWLPEEDETGHVRCTACGWTTMMTIRGPEGP